jgi:tRNA threonylcarbamoyladenosine biosynthesis protein TsaB
MTVLLALDTSTETMSLALSGAGPLRLHEGEAGAKSSARMVPELMQLLDAAGLRLHDVDALAFGRGPGAFTGLRTSCAVAQGLAYGAAKPVLPIDSLMLVAEDAAQQCFDEQARRGTIWVAMDARMNEIYAAAYEWQGEHWRSVHEPALYSCEALEQAWCGKPADVVAGSALQAFGDRLDTGVARRVPQQRARALSLACVAQQQWRLGGALDPALALPLYIRDKVALTTAERLALRDAKELQ